MKRHTLLKHLKAHCCELLREGEKYSMYHHPLERRTSAIPRHTEIANVLIRKIGKDLGIIPPS